MAFFLPDRIESRTEELRTSEEKKRETGVLLFTHCYSGGKIGLPGLLQLSLLLFFELFRFVMPLSSASNKDSKVYRDYTVFTYSISCLQLFS